MTKQGVQKKTRPNDEKNLTIVDFSILKANQQPRKLAYKFITETNVQQITYEELNMKACAIAAWLQKHNTGKQRAMLFLQSGLEYIYSFLGCLYSDVVAVPTHPMRGKRHREEIDSIIKDAGVKFIITSKNLIDESLFVGKQVLILEELDSNLCKKWQRKSISLDTLAFLQYTSGSTGQPKGVMVTHGNIMANMKAIDTVYVDTDGEDNNIIGCSWMPPYHDMGLIAGILFPLYKGFISILMSPSSFLEDPIGWLKTISREKVTHSPAPNFAYDLCVEAIKDADGLDLDLSTWKIASNGAEPVRAQTLERFNAAFSIYGLSPLTICPCYGMAETTLLLTSNDPKSNALIKSVSKVALEHGKIVEMSNENAKQSIKLVSCGYSNPGHEVIVVDSSTRKQCPSNVVGEVWVRGPSVAKGYWNKPELTNAIFKLNISGGKDCNYLGTGDLGFFDETNQLFITGRKKDLIIIRGRNIYPQDIEVSVYSSHENLISYGSAAFSVSVEDVEALVIVQEVHRHAKNHTEIFESIITHVLEDHEIIPYKIVLIRQANLPKTSSGKVRRSYCSQLLSEEKLSVVAKWEQADSEVRDYLAPRTELEIKLCGIWSEVLGLSVSRIGIKDNFFRLGGEFILAIRLVKQLNNAFR